MDRIEYIMKAVEDEPLLFPFIDQIRFDLEWEKAKEEINDPLMVPLFWGSRFFESYEPNPDPARVLAGTFCWAESNAGHAFWANVASMICRDPDSYRSLRRSEAREYLVAELKKRVAGVPSHGFVSGGVYVCTK